MHNAHRPLQLLRQRKKRVDGLLHTVMAEESVEIDEIAPQPAMA